jgi:hypothetical protein
MAMDWNLLLWEVGGGCVVLGVLWLSLEVCDWVHRRRVIRRFDAFVALQNRRMDAMTRLGENGPSR